MKYIDIHTHTNCSDGTSSVQNSLAMAQSLSLSLFSVSDHNGTSAYKEIAQNRTLFSGKILPAVEMTTTYHGEVIEVLGYGIDVDAIQKYIDTLDITGQKAVESAVVHNTKMLLHYGVVLGDAFCKRMFSDPYAVQYEYRDGKRCLRVGGYRELLTQEIKKHPENMKFFESEAVFENLNRHILTRQYMFNPDSKLFIDKSDFYPKAKEVTEQIHKAGGLAFLAHAFAYSPSIVRSLDDIVSSFGLDGLECHYGTFTKEQKKYMSEYCVKNRLYQSGGSDFHGMDMRPKNRMGYSANERIEFSLIEPWFDKVKNSLL